jgi:hypothetical protein
VDQDPGSGIFLTLDPGSGIYISGIRNTAHNTIYGTVPLFTRFLSEPLRIENTGSFTGHTLSGNFVIIINYFRLELFLAVAD